MVASVGFRASRDDWELDDARRGGIAVAQRNSLDSAFIGLALTYAIDITGVLSWVIRIVSELESHMVSVERIEEYTGLPSEEDTARCDARRRRGSARAVASRGGDQL